jgi:DNA polymerase-3 subunit alpha/error-prone DNA polymerase
MWGTASIKALCRHARRLGYDRLALTDTDNLHGLWPFLSACRAEGITPIVGAEITDPRSTRRAVCLVKNETGYRHVCRLLTRRHMETDCFDLAASLPRLSDGLAVLTSDTGLLRHWHASGVHVAAAMPRTLLPATHRLRRTAKALAIPMVATPGSFFSHPEDHAFHRLLRAIALNTTLERLSPGQIAPPDAWLAGPDVYARRFAVLPEALENTWRIAREITFTAPQFGLVMPPWPDHRNTTASEALRRAAYAGARQRYGRELPEAVVDRMEHELGTIERMDFCAYFLLVRDIVQRSPRTCGRGSGAASLVAYCLGITNVCPVKHNLYFGRFLNPGRQDPPDIDVDFAWDERDGVIEAVLDRFGPRAAMVSSHILFQPRMAVRETAKVFGLTPSEIGNVTKRLPWFWRATTANPDLMSDLSSRPEAKALEFLHPWPAIFTLAQQLIGTPRHLSVHPGGVVITPRPVCHYVPVQRAAKGVPIVQWEKEGVEDAGLVKIDLLGNRSLGVIRDAIGNVRNNGSEFNESQWEPEDDADTQATVAQGDTMGCFYIESPAMRLLQQKAGVGDFEHLVIHSSIIRPAANDCIQEYLRRLHGGTWQPLHPLLTDVLEETFGIMVYQEDVSRTAMALAGFEDAEADGLRKVLSKKDRALKLQDYYQRFAQGALRRGVTPEQIETVWQMMMSFSGYSFCKPHSASYARVSFQAAYLKTHFPAEFMAAVISNQGGFYNTFAYVSEARRMGVTILGPDVRHSRTRWTGRALEMRAGLMAVRGMDRSTVRRIIAQRTQRPFRDLCDFFSRVTPAEDEVRALIRCGALDTLAPDHSRAQMLWQWAQWPAQKESETRALSLFDLRPEIPPPPKLPADDAITRLRREFNVLGFLCRHHPMTLFARAANEARTVKAVTLPSRLGRRVRFAGWLITGKVVRTKSGDPMEFLTFEDETGTVETTFFPQTYDRYCHLIDRGRPYVLSGKVEQNCGAVTLTVNHVRPLSP